MKDYEKLISYLLSHIEHKNSTSLCKKLSRVLSINEKTIYNKINGISQFKITELLEVAKHYKIPLDDYVFSEAGAARPYPFIVRGLHYKPRSFNEYLENLIVHFDPLANRQLNVSTTFIAREIPIFHYLRFPHLLYMKLYYWNVSNWRIGNIKEYEPLVWLSNPETKFLLKKMLDLYSYIEGTEIWGTSIFSTTMSQYNELKKFSIIQSDSERELLLKDLQDTTNYIGKILEEGHKFDSNDVPRKEINVYINACYNSSDMINIRIQDQLINYVMVNTPNFIESRNQKFCQSMQDFELQVIDNSTLISNANRFYREKILRKWKSEIDSDL